MKSPARSIALTTAIVAVAALAFGAGSAGAARECDGLQVCVPVAGPWVVVPASSGAPRPQVEFQLSCPRRYVVGGLDAELSHRAIDVTFLGRMGSPVNPGITTSRSAVFVASYVGTRGAGTDLPSSHRMHARRRRWGARPHVRERVSARRAARAPRAYGPRAPWHALRWSPAARRRERLDQGLARVRVLHEPSAFRKPRLERLRQ